MTISLFFLQYYRYDIDPDDISYISIAKNYLSCNFFDAINGFWSPLVSWLLIPFLFLKLGPIFAFKLLAIVVGIFILIGVYSLLSRLEINNKISLFYTFSLTPLIAWFGLYHTSTADMLSTCLMIYYFSLTLKDSYYNSIYNTIIIGLLGAVGYFAKHYNFYFFIIHYCSINVCYFFGKESIDRKRSLIRNSVFGFVTFIVITGIWIGVVSNKYQKIVISTAGNYNFSLIAPESKGHPVHSMGFFEPTNEAAISIWEDPSYIKMGSWSPFESFGHLNYLIKNSVHNAVYYLLNLGRNPIKCFTIIFMMLIVLPLRRELFDNKWFYLLLTMLIYPMGYILMKKEPRIPIENRYVWINDILIYILNAYCVFKLTNCRFFIGVRRTILFGIIFMIIFIPPMYRLYDNRHWGWSVRHSGKYIYDLSKKVSSDYKLGRRNIASQNGDWWDSLSLCYYVNAKYYGESKPNGTDDEIKKDLIKFNIDYYFVWGGILKNNIDILLIEKDYGELKIYKVNR